MTLRLTEEVGVYLEMPRPLSRGQQAQGVPDVQSSLVESLDCGYWSSDKAGLDTAGSLPASGRASRNASKGQFNLCYFGAVIELTGSHRLAKCSVCS